VSIKTIWASRFAAFGSSRRAIRSITRFMLRTYGASHFAGGSATIPLAQDASQTQIKINIKSYAIFLLRYAKNTQKIAFVDAFGTAARAFRASARAFGYADCAFSTSVRAFSCSVYAFEASVCAFGCAAYAFGTSVHAFGYAVLKVIYSKATDF